MANTQMWDTIVQHQVFGDFVELPEGRMALQSHWICKTKCDEAGNVQQFKTMLVCGGNHPIKDINYQAMYSLMACKGHIQQVLIVTAKYTFEIHQINKCTAFLGVDFEEDINVHAP